MSAIVCAQCGGKTNTALCDWLSPMRPDGKANKCWLKWDGAKWVKGCAYESADSQYTRPWIDKVLSEQDA